MGTRRHNETIDALVAFIDAYRQSALDVAEGINEALIDDHGHLDSERYNEAIPDINDADAAVVIWEAAYSAAIDAANERKAFEA